MHPQKQFLIDEWRRQGIDESILTAFSQVQREDFVLSSYLSEVYGDYPLPILAEQTISQPSTVILMTQALEPRPGNKILEIGAGSGYQAAILSKAVGEEGHVYSLEIIKELADFAKNNLKNARIKNVTVINTDGGNGYEKKAPYDRIIVTAACPKIPVPLSEQLKTEGIIIAPVNHGFDQMMIKAIKQKDGTLEEQSLGFFRFVPLTGKHADKTNLYKQ
ncbi:protein-L-isoaspartate(D-aspartate) O-methyltransferase [Candidatus Woesearchaeota archaeon]|nr:protein-L-isoaspartate(D-aspartate) O-methyltransferase [Candidatus Woesearchaeota archaeon]